MLTSFSISGVSNGSSFILSSSGGWETEPPAAASAASYKQILMKNAEFNF